MKLISIKMHDQPKVGMGENKEKGERMQAQLSA